MPVTSGYANAPMARVDGYLRPPGTATTWAIVESTGSWPGGMTVDAIIGNWDGDGATPSPLLTVPFTITGDTATGSITGAEATTLEAAVPFGQHIGWHIRGTLGGVVTTLATGWLRWDRLGAITGTQVSRVIVGPVGATGSGGTGVQGPTGPQGPAGAAASLILGGGLTRALALTAAKLANVDTLVFKILFVGDSLTWSGYTWTERFVMRLAQHCGIATPAVLRSKVSGDVSVPATGIYGVNCAADGAGSGNYLTNGNVAAMATALQPDLVIHGVGTNDFLGSNLPDNYETNMRASLTAVNSVCTLPPEHLLWWFGSLYQDKPYPADQYISRLLSIATDNPATVTVADLGPYADTLRINDPNTGGDPWALDGGDGIHLSPPTGYRMVGELLSRVVLSPPVVNVLGYSSTVAIPDTTPPVWSATLTTGTPTQTTVTVTMTALATDNIAVAGYQVSVDGGSTYAPITPSGLVFTITGLTPSTAYPAPKFRALDAALNYSPVLTAQSFTTADPIVDNDPPTPGALGSSAITSTGFTLTVSGASDAGAGLHPQAYRFSIDNGSTYSAWQASAVYVVTGLTASTAYTCIHQVRDAASSPNLATGTAIEVTTGMGVVSVNDTFTRANSTTSLGVSDSGHTWVQIGTGIVGILSNEAYRATSNAFAYVEFGQSDMIVSVKQVVYGQFFSGPVARLVDISNFYYLDIPSALACRLKKVVAGVETGISGTSNVTFAAGDVLGISCKEVGGNTELKLLVNGVVQQTITDTSAIGSRPQGTKAGIRPWNGSNTRLDNFTVTPPA